MKEISTARKKTPSFSLLTDALFSAVALGHFSVDVINGLRAVLLAFLSVPLGLSNTALGFFSTVYVITGSLFQPVFGFFADRLGVRRLVAAGILWMAFFFTLALLTPGPHALWLLVLASLGSAAFHPAGAVQAILRGRSHLAGRETTSTAYFFVFGQSGHFMGPLIAGPILERFGMNGLLWLAAGLFVVGLYAWRNLAEAWTASETEEIQVIDGNTDTRQSSDRRVGWTLLAFATVAAFQAWSQQNMITFVPKYISDLGQSPAVYGLIAALFMGGSAFGSGLGGNLADRFGKRRVAAISLSLASIPLFVVGAIGWSPLLFVIIPLAGMFTGAVHSILVVLAQRMIPGGMAMASGLILGFMFSTGALGTALCGYLADQAGFPLVFQFTAALALTASVLALTLQRN